MALLDAQPPPMGATENNNYGNVLIAGTCLFGVVAFVGAALFLYMTTFNYELADTDKPKERKHKERRVAQRLMLMFGAIGSGLLAMGYLFVLFKIGTFTRSDGFVENWSYFAFVSVAYAFFGMLHGIFFRIQGYSYRMFLAVLFALSPLLLALGPITPSESKRDVLFGFAVAFQFITVVYIFWFEGIHGPMKRLYGLIPVGLVLVAFLLQDVFWFIGFLNQDNSAVQLTSRWNAQIAFLFADLLVVLSGVAAIVLYRPERIVVPPTIEAGFAAGPDGAALYVNANDASMKF